MNHTEPRPDPRLIGRNFPKTTEQLRAELRAMADALGGSQAKTSEQSK